MSDAMCASAPEEFQLRKHDMAFRDTCRLTFCCADSRESGPGYLCGDHFLDYVQHEEPSSNKWAAMMEEQDEITDAGRCYGCNPPDESPSIPVPSQKFATPPAATGKKADAGKAPIWQGFTQYFPRAIRAVANVSKYGAEKYELDYGDVNWKRVRDCEARYRDGLDRHITYELLDGAYDPESSLLHAAHAAWNAMAVLEKLLETGTPEQKDVSGT